MRVLALEVEVEVEVSALAELRSVEGYCRCQHPRERELLLSWHRARALGEGYDEFGEKVLHCELK